MMKNLAETKKAMAVALKMQFGQLKLPGEQSKIVNAKMQLSARLSSGCQATLSCAEVKGGRPVGHYALYWILSLREGPVWQVMIETGLDKAKNVFSDVLFATTSHNISGNSHFEVTPTSEFSEIAAKIVESMKHDAFPIIRYFDTDFENAVDYLVAHRPVEARNPFTTSVILLHLARRTQRIPELEMIAATKPGFYDFVDSHDPKKSIVEPIGRWFVAHPR